MYILHIPFYVQNSFIITILLFEYIIVFTSYNKTFVVYHNNSVRLKHCLICKLLQHNSHVTILLL